MFKINFAVSTDRTQKQWVDLGIHTEACMTRPDTCGATGGALSMWMKLVDCPDWSGVISSHESGTGWTVYCRNPNILRHLMFYLI